MLQGKLLHSHFGQAGCLGGHLTVNYRGRRCSCGAVGCAEAEASTSVLAEICHATPDFENSSLAREDVIQFESLFRCKDNGDSVSIAVVQHCIEIWSALTVSLIHAYGPEVVVFGGAVMKRDEEILKPIRVFVAHNMWITTRGVPLIKAALLGSEAALFGAEALFERREHELYI
jgi:glucokinase